METYKTSWVRRLVDNVWTKTFAFAHAKTVYTDYANKKTLADKLSGVDLEIAQQSTEMMDIKMLGWSVPRECPVQNEINGNQFIQKVGRVDASSLSWEYVSSSFRGFRFYAGLGDKYTKFGIKHESKAYLYGFTYLGDLNQWSKIMDFDDKVIAGVWVGGKDEGFVVRDDAYTDVDTFKSAMQGQYLYYELATPIITTIDGNEIGETVSNVRKETTVNLLKPTLQTTTSDGVTCTNNGDGTYTVEGTLNSIKTYFELGTCILNAGEKYKIIGSTKSNKYLCAMYIQFNDGSDTLWETDNEGIYIPNKTGKYSVIIRVYENGTAVDNIVFKPMITTNLNATYDDFVPYTGDTGSLNGDVADLRSDVDNIYNYEATEKEIGKFEGKTLYKSTGIFDFSTPITFNAGDKKAFGSSAGIYALASSSNVGFKLNEISKVLNSECFAETSGYFFTNPFIIINDKTGYLWCKNISGEQISATKIIFTLSYTK